MKVSCIRHTSLPGTSQLVADFHYDFERVRRFFGRSYLEPGSYQSAARDLNFPDGRRQALVAALAEQNPDSPQLEKLAQPGTVAVVTGQQVGLFSGPSYTVYKALTASVLAARLSDQGIPAVPVFWLATEDHDFDEVHTCWSFGSAQQPISISLAETPKQPTPVGRLCPQAYPVEAFRSSVADLPFGPQVADLLGEAYTNGRSLGEAFQCLLQKLLPNAGLLYLDPLRPAFRNIAAPFLRDAVLASAELSAAILERSRDLEAAGYHAQVHFESATSLFFVLENGVRRSLRRDGVRYALGKERLSVEALADRDEALSPTALLRPAMQDYLLPTAAFVGGPGEIAYLAQCEVVYRRLLGRFPVVVPRSGLTLLDARALKLMQRYELELTNLFENPGVAARISRQLVPAELVSRIRQTGADASARLDALERSLRAFDPTLETSARKSRAKIQYQFSKIEAKVEREALRRDARALEDAAYLENLIYPDKHLQERRYSILPFLARHGIGLVDTVRDNIHLDCSDHIVLPV